jgi:hypothetical protein
MTYEYDFEQVLTKEALDNVDMGLVEPASILAAIKKVLNERAKKGWEPLTPFTLPVVWFRKTKK